MPNRRNCVEPIEATWPRWRTHSADARIELREISDIRRDERRDVTGHRKRDQNDFEISTRSTWSVFECTIRLGPLWYPGADSDRSSVDCDGEPIERRRLLADTIQSESCPSGETCRSRTGSARRAPDRAGIRAAGRFSTAEAADAAACSGRRPKAKCSWECCWSDRGVSGGAGCPSTLQSGIPA